MLEREYSRLTGEVAKAKDEFAKGIAAPSAGEESSVGSASRSG